MRFFVLFFMCLSCFSAPECNDGWLWGAWGRVKSSASRFIAAVNPLDENTVPGSVCGAVNRVKNSIVNTVYEKARGWWWGRSRREKVNDLVLAGMLTSGAVIIGSSVPSMYAGTWHLLPKCLCCRRPCDDHTQVPLYYIKAWPVLFATWAALHHGALATKSILGFTARFLKSNVAAPIGRAAREQAHDWWLADPPTKALALIAGAAFLGSAAVLATTTPPVVLYAGTVVPYCALAGGCTPLSWYIMAGKILCAEAFICVPAFFLTWQMCFN